MYACSPTLRTMIERKVNQAHLSDPVAVEPAEFARRIYGALSELFQTRLRIVEFAPRNALTRAWHRDHATTIAPSEWDRLLAKQA